MVAGRSMVQIYSINFAGPGISVIDILKFFLIDCEIMTAHSSPWRTVSILAPVSELEILIIGEISQFMQL